MFLLLVVHPGIIQEDHCFFSYKSVQASHLYLKAVHLNVV